VPLWSAPAQVFKPDFYAQEETQQAFGKYPNTSPMSSVRMENSYQNQLAIKPNAHFSLFLTAAK
jgi:hypothetical protein